MGRKITAVEACERGLVTDVFPETEFSREVTKRIAEMGALPTKVKSNSENKGYIPISYFEVFLILLYASLELISKSIIHVLTRIFF